MLNYNTQNNSDTLYYKQKQTNPTDNLITHYIQFKIIHMEYHETNVCCTDTPKDCKS